MIIPDKHISVSSGDDIRTICNPLFENSDVNFFIYCRFYDDGTLVSFPSNTKWHKHFMEKEYFSNKLRMKEGVHLWTIEKQYSLANITARNYFNIDNKFEIVERGQDYYDVYGFASPRGRTKVIDHFMNNIDFFKRFGLYFKNRARGLIKSANKLENRLTIRHQIINCENFQSLKYNDHFMKNRIKRYYMNVKNVPDSYLTDREMQVVLYTLKQRSAVEIGKIFNISEKTVEAYLASAKEKLNVKSRAELFDCLLEARLLELL